jgi:hypothetical protein
MKRFLIPAFFVIDTSVDENEAVKIAAEMQTWANAHGANYTNAHLLLDEELPNREVDIDPEETELPHTYNWKPEMDEQQRRDEKHGLYPEHEDIAN